MAAVTQIIWGLSKCLYYGLTREKNICIFSIQNHHVGEYMVLEGLLSHYLEQGTLSATQPRHLSVSSPGLPWKDRFKQIVPSLQHCKHSVFRAASIHPSIFTVNGRLCHICLLSLSYFNPYISYKPGANLFKVLVCPACSSIHMNRLWFLFDLADSFLLSQTKQ